MSEFHAMKSLLKTIAILLVVTLSVGCKKFTKEIANAEKPADAPEYTVNFDANHSPAEGGTRKPTN